MERHRPGRPGGTESRSAESREVEAPGKNSLFAVDQDRRENESSQSPERGR